MPALRSAALGVSLRSVHMKHVQWHAHLAQDLQRTFEAAKPARRIRLGGQHTGLVMGLQLHGPGTGFPDDRRLPDRTGVDQSACGRQLDKIGRGAIQLTTKWQPPHH